MKERILSFVLCMCMAITLLPLQSVSAASAPTSYGVWVGDTEVTSDNANNITGDGITGTVSYDNDTKTLTLSGADITSNYTFTSANTDGLTAGICAGQDLNIVLADNTESNVTVKNSTDDIDFNYGILVAGNLTISGKGKLNVTGGKITNTGYTLSTGIYSYENLTINSGEITAGGGEAYISYGIVSVEDVTINGGTVKATGSDAATGNTVKYSDGIQGNKVTINGGIVNATAGDGDDESNGICSYDCITISGGTVTAKGNTKAFNKVPTFGSDLDSTCTVSTNYDGSNSSNILLTDDNIKSFKYVKFTEKYKVWVGNTQVTLLNKDDVLANGTVSYNSTTKTLTLSDADITSNHTWTFYTINFTAGIYAEHDLNIVLADDNTESNVTGDLTDNANSNYGIYVEGNLTISGKGQLTATGSDAIYSVGISSNSVEINGGTVNATGGNKVTDDNMNYSEGIEADNVTISGGTINATGGNSNYSYGIISCNGDVTISGGIVNATGGATNENSIGIYSREGVTISGGKVTANGGNSDYSCGIFACSDFTISSGEVLATGSDTATGNIVKNSEGIDAANVTISGGTVAANGGATSLKSNGIYSFNDTTITGGEVTAIADASAESYGIYADNDKNITLNSGTVTAKGNTQAFNKLAVISFDYSPRYTVSTDISGTPTTEYNESDFISYKYVKIENAVNTDSSDTTPLSLSSSSIPAYKIIKGANQVLTSSENGLTVVSDGDFDEFKGVKVDLKLISAEDYGAELGSTIVTLKPEFLTTLGAGNHTISLLFNSQSVTTNFTINKEVITNQSDTSDEKDNPKTGNTIPLSMLILCTLSVATIIVTKRKKI